MNNENIIIRAIQMKRVISFFYKEGNRTVEPFLIGYHKDTGNLTLRAYFIEGHSKSGRYNTWKLYTVEDIEDIRLLDESFSGRRENYNPEDKMMSSIVAKV